MVGVPGRSKGCHTCLKRRIKCDESRPTCKRCQKAGYDCGGYQRQLELRFHTFADPAGGGVPTPATTSKLPPTFSNSCISKNLVPRSSQDDQSSVPPELSLVAFREDVQFSFLFDNFVWSSYGSPWLQLAAAGKLDALSLEACRVFSLGTFGRHHHQREIEVSGAIHYDKTVRALSSRLSNVGSAGSEALIVPITILLMQSSASLDPQATTFHVQALAKLIQVCGPERFTAKPLRQAFESCRATLITISLIMRLRTFLEEPAWIDGPWTVCGSSHKSAQNQLVDILVHVPGFLQDHVQLEQSPSDHLRLDLAQRIEHQISKLYIWRWNWQDVHPNAAWEVDPESSPPDGVFSYSRPVPKALVFSSFARAIEISLYNAVLLCLLGLHWSLKEPTEESSSSSEPLQSPLRLPEDITSLDEPAVEICRAFEFQLANAQNYRDSALFWLLPLGLASKVLEDDVEHMAWIRGMLDTSVVTRGYGTAQNSAGFGFYKFPRMKKKKNKNKTTPRPSMHATEIKSGSLKIYGDGVTVPE